MSNSDASENGSMWGAGSLNITEAAIALAGQAPKVPDWFEGEYSDDLVAAREIHDIVAGKYYAPPGIFEDLVQRAGDAANNVIRRASYGRPFLLENRLQLERQIQWRWYYARECLKAYEIYFPGCPETVIDSKPVD